MSTPQADTFPTSQSQAMTRLQCAARRTLFRQLGMLRGGGIKLKDVDDNVYSFGEIDASLQSEILVNSPAFYTELFFGGANGAAEAWCLGYWHSERLVQLIRILVRNQELRRTFEGGLTQFLSPFRRLRHWMQRNTKRGSRVNIASHYDLGNDFFALFLDESMMYSAAVFDPPEVDLETASKVKLRQICDKLSLKRGQHILEIGSGWGGFAEFAATEYDCRVTTTTISQEQYSYTCDRIAEAGLTDRVTVLKEDYRELSGLFDHIVSIEMIEAVGAENYRRYFELAARRLRNGGRFVMQAITIGDDEFDRARREVDFIKRYIFPGSCIPSLLALRDASRSARLEWIGQTDITTDYARTLAEWRRRFVSRRAAIAELGLPESFQRMWFYYFCYCEAGFTEGYIGDFQITLRKPL